VEEAARVRFELDEHLGDAVPAGRVYAPNIGWSIGEAERAAIAGIPTSDGHRRSTPTAAYATAT
jgi:hypothetical protein